MVAKQWTENQVKNWDRLRGATKNFHNYRWDYCRRRFWNLKALFFLV